MIIVVVMVILSGCMAPLSDYTGGSPTAELVSEKELDTEAEIDGVQFNSTEDRALFVNENGNHSIQGIITGSETGKEVVVEKSEVEDNELVIQLTTEPIDKDRLQSQVLTGYQYKIELEDIEYVEVIDLNHDLPGGEDRGFVFNIDMLDI